MGAATFPEVMDQFCGSLLAPSERISVTPDSRLNAATLKGPVPGAHCCDTVGFFKVESAREAETVEQLVQLFAEPAAAEPADTWHRHFVRDVAWDARPEVPLFVGCTTELARSLALMAPEGVLAEGNTARHVAYARNCSSGELASVMDLAIDIRCSDVPEGARLQLEASTWQVELVINLNFIYTRTCERRKGAAAALVEFAGYVFHHEVERILEQLCPLAGQDDEDVIIRVRLEEDSLSQGGHMMRGLLAETLEANMSMMAEVESLPFENFAFESQLPLETA